ncbi:hypothetical protein QTP86_003061 [Hemibagrus guttatus]|nr:hypothetical protein QTP86_003061 [Hemibagrus guttatus]
MLVLLTGKGYKQIVACCEDLSESSSSSSDESPARSLQSAAVPAPSSQALPPMDKDEPRKSFGIKVQNLPVRSTDTSLKDGLFHEFKKHGKVTSVQIHGASEERYGLVFFRQQEDQEKALSASKGKLFFGMQIDVTAWTGPETESENEFRPLDERIDEFHPKATRTLFIGNLEKTTSYHDLLNIFQRFGDIVDIDIKKVNGAPQYAFLQYCDIASVCKAIKKMDGEYLGSNRLKLGFGKSMPTTCVWLDGLASNITEQYLTRHFCRYGHVVKVVFDRLKGMALVLYNNIECAQAAVKETKGWKIGGNKIKVDFANHESQMAFYRSMQASGQDIRDFYDILSDRRDERRPLYHEFSNERACYENVRTPGTYAEELRRKYSARSREFYTEWDSYTADYYDPRYYDEPCEFRDYRDPYEQDIRKYSYMQRERNRDRERFETERERDHSRRTAEHNQSPTHPRRPSSPTASPVLTERLVNDSEHHIYSRSSERSGSCSSISPPRFEKLDRVRLERYSKSDKLEKERPLFEVERGSGGEKERRAGRKEKGEKDRNEKHKLRKLKLSSPGIPSSEADLEPDREASPDAAQRNSGKTLANEKESGKGRIDLPPCVVHLTRVKEKEGKFIDHAIVEKQRIKDAIEHVNTPTPPPLADHKTMLHRIEIQSREVLKHGKMAKDKCLSSQVEIVDKEGKIKGRKNLKAEPVFEKSNSDVDRLAARKRRFEEETTRSNRVRRITQDEDEGRFGLKWLGSIRFSKGLDEDKKFAQLETPKRESRIDKKEGLVTISSTSEEPDSEMSKNLGHNIDLQLRELAEEETDPMNKLDQRMRGFGAKDQQYLSLKRKSNRNTVTDIDIFQAKKSLMGHEGLCWESKMKQDTLKEMSFPSTIVKRDSIRKRPVHELEPGEVRSDSEDEDDDNDDDDDYDDYTQMSPKLDSSLKRECEGNILDLKLSGSLEKNKFYEFALDKTITPDTKALLERAKSLSSSREDNWSFLGYDSRFTNFRNCTDKEKVEPTPRPIPSWYMKKKKIRSDSEGKLVDKKEEDPKREEQENGELFASRFLHSSIFEQDSRRLRHLECKDNDPEIGISREKATVTVEKAETLRLKMYKCLLSIEKPAIRKSERIDREKLKRASSPRGEATKIISDSKNSSKSPVFATDLEQINDSNMSHGRTRQRRNVRSVYATPHEDEAQQQPGKDCAESSRSMRKRPDKESVQQDVLTPPANTRRGRPPKTRKRMDDVSPLKGEQTNTPEVDDTNIKESGKGGEMTKVAEGWRSPRSQKVQAIVRAGQSRKAAKTDKASEADISESLKSQVKAKDETPSLDKMVKKSEPDLMDKPQMSEKSVKVKLPRLTRSTKTVPIDKSVNLKNLVIDLSGDAVKDALYSGDESSQHCQDPLKKSKTELSIKEDSGTAKDFKDIDDLSPDEREDALSDVEPPAVAEAVFLARQMELERAVENISNLAVEQPPTYKEPSCQPPVVLMPVAAEPDHPEVEKPANPASETELAAAIDSITAENISADADGFHTPPTYTSLLPPSESLVLPTSNEVIGPETDLVIKNVRDFEPSSSLTPDTKSSQPTVVTKCPPSEVPKKLEDDYCLLLALPCGLDQDDVLMQTHALKTCFITYLQAKQAAGIINVPNPGSNQPAYVVQIFPPCDFSEIHLSHLAPDLLKSISSISPHLMIVIASV